MTQSDGVLLPCRDSADWKKLQRFFDLLSSVDSLPSFKELIARGDAELRGRFAALSGLAEFLEQHCSEQERGTFFGGTLSFISHSARCLTDLLPDAGIPRLKAQQNGSLGIGRPLAMSLLANSFLCTFSDPSIEEEKACLFSFARLYRQLQAHTEKAMDVAALLKFCVAYFQFHNKWRTKSPSGLITFQRQGLLTSDVPSLSAWQGCSLPLCTVTVDRSGNFEELHGEHLQVDSAHCVSGSSLNEGSMKGRYFLYPELLISCLVLEPLEDSEAVVISGVERFVEYSLCGEKLECVGARSEVDGYQSYPTSVVAIDAASFHKCPDRQFTDHCLLRDLNKALAGFLCCQEARDRVFDPNSDSNATTQSSAQVFHGSEGSLPCVSEPSPPSTASESLVAQTAGVSKGTVAESAISTCEASAAESSAAKLDTASKLSSTQASGLVSSIIRCGVEMASGRRAGDAPQVTAKVTDLAGDLSSNILSSVLSEKPSSATSHSVPRVEDSAAGGLKSDPLFINHTEEVTPRMIFSNTADILAKSIIADVLSQDWSVPNSPPALSPKTVGQPTSPAVEWKVHSYADKMADGILSDLFSGPQAPVSVVKKPVENGQSSQSSSLTGQGITPHEFTDDLVECVVREGLLIAQLQARETERQAISADTEGDAKEAGRAEEDEGLGQRVTESGCGRNVSDIAEQLVAQSIQCVLENAQKKADEERSRESGKGLHPFPGAGGASRRSESPLRSSGRLGLLRQALDRPKLLTTSAEGDAGSSDVEQSVSSSFLHVSVPSSRMSYAWSVASTRDEGSRPVSPTDLDRMALSFVSTIEEYGSMFAELVIRGAIAEVTGNKKYMCHVPVSSHHTSRESLHTSGDVRIPVPVLSSGDGGGSQQNAATSSRLDSFLSTLDEAEPLVEGEERDEGEEFTWDFGTAKNELLRKVATSNWGCGELGGDPQLKAMLQWAAVTASGRTEMIYFTCQHPAMEQLENVTAHVQSKQWTVGQLISAIVKYSHLGPEGRQEQTLFQLLLRQ